MFRVQELTPLNQILQEKDEEFVCLKNLPDGNYKHSNVGPILGSIIGSAFFASMLTGIVFTSENVLVL